MIEDELHELIEKIQRRGCEGQTLDVTAAHQGCPEKLYDTISAFANQDAGGILLFGLSERSGRDKRSVFEKVGVYDAHDLQKKVMEYCEQMTPVIRPVFTVCDEDGKVFVSAEIPPLDMAERPCFQSGKGRLKGAYVRVGDADKPMTEYEVYSYEAYRKKYRDDIRPVEGVFLADLDQELLGDYQARMRRERPNLARLTEQQQLKLNSIVLESGVTMAALLLFGLYPQAYYPRLCINATCIPGSKIGDVDKKGNRFTDTKRIEGTLPEMLEQALDFVRVNTRTSIGIDPLSGKRIDLSQYPMDAVREAVLNALVHRDYSIHTENQPIQLNLYDDRLEMINPGGLYGRLTVDQLGHTQPDTRNPVLVTAMEILKKTENRYSGIPTIRHAMAQRHLPEPVFINTSEAFSVILYHKTAATLAPKKAASHVEKKLLAFCSTPRSRAEIMEHLQLNSGQYVLRRYVEPLLRSGALRMTLPDKPRSHKQRFVAAESGGSVE